MLIRKKFTTAPHGKVPIFLFFFIIGGLFFFIPTHVHALTDNYNIKESKSVDPLGNCAPAPNTIVSCTNGGVCSDVSTLGMGGSNQICVPAKDYQACGTDTNCTSGCAIVQSRQDPTAFGLACLDANDIPNGSAGDLCDTSQACVTNNKQCVRVIGVSSGLTGIFKKTVAATRCVLIAKLPENVVEKVAGSNAGVCGSNSTCPDGQFCMQQIFDPNNSSIPRVCTSNAGIISPDACGDNSKTIGNQCNSGDKKGLCIGKLVYYQNQTKPDVFSVCYDPTYIPGGQGGATGEKCTVDSDCKLYPDYHYCILNPQTSQGQCFAQASVYTTLPATTDACPTEGAQDCESGKDSYCTKYFGADASKPVRVCIHYAHSGAALGTGYATQSTAQLSVAPERLDRFAPQLEINIPTVSFIQKITGVETDNGKTFFVPYIAQYVNGVYKYAIGFGVLIAIVLIMFAGIRWMTSLGNAGSVSGARTMITNAVLGLVLLLSVYSLLGVLNPNLLNLKSVAILAPTQDVLTFEDGQDVPVSEADQDVTIPEKPQRICHSVTECAPYCTGEKKIPDASPGMAGSGDLVDIKSWFAAHAPDHAGLNIARGGKLRAFVFPALLKAGKNAAENGYVLRVQSTYRPLADQLSKYCNHFGTDGITPKSGNKFSPATLAWPGGSNHGAGVAIDFSLLKNGSAVAGYAKKSEHGQPYEDLKKIMYDAGWVRLKSEEWHFEFHNGGDAGAARCTC